MIWLCLDQGYRRRRQLKKSWKQLVSTLLLGLLAREALQSAYSVEKRHYMFLTVVPLKSTVVLLLHYLG